MPENLVRIAAAEWAAALADLGVGIAGTVAVAGEGAEGVAEALQKIGAPWLLAQSDGFALLGAESGGEQAPPGGLGAVPEGSLDVVVVLRAWSSVPEMVTAVADASRVLSPGGAVVLGDVDYPRLRSSRPDRYSAALLYRAHPAVAAAIAGGFVGILDLTVAIGRAGLRTPSAVPMDRAIARYGKPEDFIANAPGRWWRGFDLLSDDEATSMRGVLARTLQEMAPGEAVTDREPWNLAVGRKPGAE